MGTTEAPKYRKYSLRERLNSLYDGGEPLIPGDTIEQLLSDLKDASGGQRFEPKPLTHLVLPDGLLTVAALSVDREETFLRHYLGALSENEVLERFASETSELVSGGAIVESLEVLDISVPG